MDSKRIDSLSGKSLKSMFASGARALEQRVEEINALNVFPVPDGDTGTNMLLTLRSINEAAEKEPSTSAGKVAEAMAKGALMGARGNSGVIVSQLFRGLSQGLKGLDSFNKQDLCDALELSVKAAYRSVGTPVEGTILTVIRESSYSASEAALLEGSDIRLVWEALSMAAGESVARTPLKLPILAKAGVVDSGGQGLAIIYQGVLRWLTGSSEENPLDLVEPVSSIFEDSPINTEEFFQSSGQFTYGYCTQFIIEGEDLDPDVVREKLALMADSAVVIGEKSTVRVHVHTYDPGTAISYGVSLGTLAQVDIKNMDEQNETVRASITDTLPQDNSRKTTAIIPVSLGSGFEDLFLSLGATNLVAGGQSMNPSTKEILEVIDNLEQDQVIFLPNNKNILPAAEQAALASSKPVHVVPTVSIPQGIAAILAFNSEQRTNENILAMETAISTVVTVEITEAVRQAELDGISVSRGQSIGLVDGRLVTTSDSIEDTVLDVLLKAEISRGSLVTLYYGDSQPIKEAQNLVSEIEKRYPGVEIELLSGGQPSYSYILSIE